ncbi:putative hydroxylase [Triangularia verruculosa]|uniref:Hydroxylase n=1 Tax=Triangularia verruculosa TaxID=2587418 RepID=A0AAN6XA33_9PEZI|nr:putative hydroxylase [Triangularia verruculosa]
MATPEIAIIGAGPCGLTLARLLECKGITGYILYERDEGPDAKRAGGSLDIHPETGQNALRHAGLFDKFKEHARYADTAFALGDKDGNKVFEMGEGRDAPEIDRVELRKILLDSVPKDKIKWGHALKEVSLGQDRKPVLHFGNGMTLSGMRLVVGADGAWSKVRPVITPAMPQFSGKTYLEGRIRRDNPFYDTMAKEFGSGMYLTVSDERISITQRQGDGSYRIYFGLQTPEGFFRTLDLQNLEAARNMLLSSEYYGDWAELYKDLIRHSTHFWAWSLYTLSKEDLNWESVSGATLCGDAAHVTIPNGEGVNTAMADALDLANSIEKHGIEHLDDAVKEYEARMFPRAIESILQGEIMADAMFVKDPQVFLQKFGPAMGLSN